VKARLSERAIQGLLIAAGVLLFGNVGRIEYQNFAEDRQEKALALQGVKFRAPRPREISLETPRGEPRAIRFGDGSYVTLGPRTEFGFEEGLWLAGLHGRLEGEATIEVSKADGTLFLETGAGKVLLYVGTYALRCEVDCTELLITVGAGRAQVQGNSPKTRLILTAGQFARVPADGTPERTAGGDGYPTIATFGKAAP
jgi:ferric-dicitrate binding protein FerR (iron transport regulator)